MGGIRIDRVTKQFPHGVRAVHEIDLEIADGEFMVLVGPSGCGKSTLLRLIAGLEEVTDGSIMIGDQEVTHLQPCDRDVAMVFQNYALYPHLSVRGNIGFGLRLRKVRRPEIDRRVGEVARILGLEQCLDRKPGALSGGQRQRVAMGRAMVREPRAFLMDEPLSNLDASLRVSMRAELTRLHQELGVTTVYVTHDQVEAMTLGRRVAVLRDGVLQQCDAPHTLYQRPANLFVAGFIGSPSMNFAQAAIESGTLHVGSSSVKLTDDMAVNCPAGSAIVGIRPSDLELAGVSTAELGLRLSAVVEIVEDLGSEVRIIFATDAPPVLNRLDGPERDADGVPGNRAEHRFIAQLFGRTRVRAGDHLELVASPERLHLFNPDTGATLTRAELRETARGGGLSGSAVALERAPS